MLDIPRMTSVLSGKSAPFWRAWQAPAADLGHLREQGQRLPCQWHIGESCLQDLEMRVAFERLRGRFVRLDPDDGS